ncbi:MAG: type 3 dihydrofolate reductase [Thiohalomonadaceae bacterium]
MQTKKISIIAALAENRVIGIENRLPWHLPGDMRWFRRHTLGKPILMGRKTFESLGRPLPERHNIVVTKDTGYQAAGATVVHSIDEALQTAGDVSEVMIIGGESFYRQMLPQADRLILTLVHAKITGDAWFPEFAWADWQEIEREDHVADEQNTHAFSFLVLEKREDAV